MQETTTTVTRAFEPDMPALLEILGAFLAAIDDPPLDETSTRRMEAAIRDGKIRFFLARQSDTVVGVCSLTIGFSTYHASPFGVMEDFYIVPEKRKTGIARIMMTRLLSEAEQEGCRSVLLGCGDQDMGLYESFGFKKIGNMMARDLPL